MIFRTGAVVRCSGRGVGEDSVGFGEEVEFVGWGVLGGGRGGGGMGGEVWVVEFGEAEVGPFLF